MGDKYFNDYYSLWNKRQMPAEQSRTERKKTMEKEYAKINKATVSELSSDELDAVSGGTVSEEDYAVTSEKKCPYCSSTQVYKYEMQKNIGFTKVLTEYKCRKCGDCFWYEQ